MVIDSAHRRAVLDEKIDQQIGLEVSRAGEGQGPRISRFPSNRVGSVNTDEWEIVVDNKDRRTRTRSAVIGRAEERENLSFIPFHVEVVQGVDGDDHGRLSVGDRDGVGDRARQRGIIHSVSGGPSARLERDL